MTKQPLGPPMTLGDMRELVVHAGIALEIRWFSFCCARMIFVAVTQITTSDSRNMTVFNGVPQNTSSCRNLA